jgi:hypothetical protein
VHPALAVMQARCVGAYAFGNSDISAPEPAGSRRLSPIAASPARAW